MSPMPPGDPFVENVLRSVPGDVARTLTSAQWEGVRHAHRHARSRILEERRSRTSRVAVAAFLAALFVCFVAVLFLFLYVLKSAAGIDIFPNFHLFAWSQLAGGPVAFPRDLPLLSGIMD